MALLFDLDGTLVDSAQGIAVALSQISVSRGGNAVDVALVRSLVSHGVSTLVSEALGPSARDSAEDIAEFRSILKDVPADSAMIFPGVVEALRELTALGHSCAIVTNKPEQLSRRLLDALDLTRFFGAIVGGDTLGVCKPDPEPLLYAMRLMGAQRSVMIGDSKIDAEAAAAGGLPFLLFEGGYGGAECEHVPKSHRFGVFADIISLVIVLENSDSSISFGKKNEGRGCG